LKATAARLAWLAFAADVSALAGHYNITLTLPADIEPLINTISYAITPLALATLFH